MADRDRLKVLTDAQWEVLAPLIAACRPPYKTDHHDLRRTIEAIIWRREMAPDPGRTGSVVDGGADLQPVVAPGRLGAAAGGGAAAWRDGGRDGGPDGTGIRAHHKA